MAKNNDSNPNLHNHIASGTEIVGDIKANGNLRVEGTIKGSLDCNGKLSIGQSGLIEGEIICENSIIEGTVKGKIKVKALLTLKETAKFIGDIITDKLAIEPNAIFTGNCNMGGDTVDAKEEKKKK